MTTGFDGLALKEQGARKAAERDALIAKAQKLQAEGLTWKIIAQRLGVSEAMLSTLLKGRRWMEPRRPR